MNESGRIREKRGLENKGVRVKESDPETKRSNYVCMCKLPFLFFHLRNLSSSKELET